MKRFIWNLFYKLGYNITRVNTRQLKSIRSNRLVRYDTPTGKYYLPADAHHDIIANAIKSGSIFEMEVVSLAAKYIKPSTAVLDIGSNFGQMAILFSNMAGENGKIYAFDADDFVFHILKMNIEANHKGNSIISTFGAVHNAMGETLFFPVQDFKRYGTYGSYGIDYKGRKGREVPSLTIDSMNITEPISFMKVDVQGGDLLAMQGAVKTIERNRMPILFEYEYHLEEELGLCFQGYVDFVAQIGYKFERVVNGHNYLIVPK